MTEEGWLVLRELCHVLCRSWLWILLILPLAAQTPDLTWQQGENKSMVPLNPGHGVQGQEQVAGRDRVG